MTETSQIITMKFDEANFFIVSPNPVDDSKGSSINGF